MNGNEVLNEGVCSRAKLEGGGPQDRIYQHSLLNVILIQKLPGIFIKNQMFR